MGWGRGSWMQVTSPMGLDQEGQPDWEATSAEPPSSTHHQACRHQVVHADPRVGQRHRRRSNGGCEVRAACLKQHHIHVHAGLQQTGRLGGALRLGGTLRLQERRCAAPVLCCGFMG